MVSIRAFVQSSTGCGTAGLHIGLVSTAPSLAPGPSDRRPCRAGGARLGVVGPGRNDITRAESTFFHISSARSLQPSQGHCRSLDASFDALNRSPINRRSRPP
ncbi:hypothetical protein CKAH01_18161 [Colletotrichum kahawae]|uniref:Uncharacterized protein n=1 Tax=Colletotrichum kahawae TaxID=34407 RepID=A0AAD9Y7Q6_COLKA|nr:hypothetical protein CKAH01_18161 [Colletotrichum kahawae]